MAAHLKNQWWELFNLVNSYIMSGNFSHHGHGHKCDDIKCKNI